MADLQDARPDPIADAWRLKRPEGKAYRAATGTDPIGLGGDLAASGRHFTQRAPLLTKPDGTTWQASDPRLPFRKIVRQAKLDPDVVTLYALRHSSITRQLVAGIPVRVVAYVHDTSTAMIEASYSSLIGDHSDALVRGSLLNLALPPQTTCSPCRCEADAVTRPATAAILRTSEWSGGDMATCSRPNIALPLRQRPPWVDHLGRRSDVP